MRNRDFVTQRSWYWKDDEFIIFNHTVHHKVHVTILFVYKMFGIMGCTSNHKEGLFGYLAPSHGFPISSQVKSVPNLG